MTHLGDTDLHSRWKSWQNAAAQPVMRELGEIEQGGASDEGGDGEGREESCR